MAVANKSRYTKRNITEQKDKLIKTDKQTEKNIHAKKPTNKLDKQQKQMDRKTERQKDSHTIT